MAVSRVRLVAAAGVAVLLLLAALIVTRGSDLPSAPPSRGVNLLTGETASLEHAIGSWRSEGAQLAVKRGGGLAITTTFRGYTLTLSGDAVRAIPGQVYAGSFSARARTTAREVLPVLYFYDASGRVLDRVRGELEPDTSFAWRPLMPVVAIAPTTAVSVAVGALTSVPVGEVHYLRSPVITTTAPKGTDVVGPLRTVGNRIVDAHGPVLLRGIHRLGLEGMLGSTATPEDLAEAKRWGATMVRLSVSSAYWLTTSCHHDAGYALRLDRAVRSVTSRGMVALIDLHTNAFGPCGKVGPQVMADATAPAFWREVAARYAADPLVAFDLYNEPHDISDDAWLHGGTVKSPLGSVQVAGMQTMYDAVRSSGATNLVFISGPGYANTPPPSRVTGDNIVYGVHAYTCPQAVQATTCLPNASDPSQILQPWVELGRHVPVLVTEFGWPSKASGRYVGNVIDFARDHGWGWIAFAWDGRSDGVFSLLATAGSGATYEPSPAGMPVLLALASAP